MSTTDITMLIDTVKLEKMALAKRVGQFLVAEQVQEERATVENVARVLAQDVSAQVREVLAYELRKCKVLATDLAEKIAHDVESVSGAFLGETMVFTDKEWLKLIPGLKEPSLVVVARRKDLSDSVQAKLATVGQEPTVTSLVRNDNLTLAEVACDKVVDRFGDNRRMMDHLGARADLPLKVVERIINNVSDHCREMLIEHYAVDQGIASKMAEDSKIEVLWTQLKNASPTQIHAFVTDLRNDRRLNYLLVIEITGRGCPSFMESSLALEAGLPLGRIREILSLEDPAAFVRLMQMANVSKSMAPRFLQLAKKFYSKTSNVTPIKKDEDSAQKDAVA
ncbi:DUF2336 domain-containing protein [Kordiimonas sp.]|uniref:DUF2336 domain-containing protein n=1 Tax=Kordiimonas sp. TaxID=1970157 RepID=UPI003A8CF47C